MLSRPPIVASIILQNAYLYHDNYVEKYDNDEDIKNVYEKPTHGAQVDGYYFRDKLLYHIGKL